MTEFFEGGELKRVKLTDLEAILLRFSSSEVNQCRPLCCFLITRAGSSGKMMFYGLRKWPRAAALPLTSVLSRVRAGNMQLASLRLRSRLLTLVFLLSSCCSPPPRPGPPPSNSPLCQYSFPAPAFSKLHLASSSTTCHRLSSSSFSTINFT